MTEYHISVRGLVEFLLREGDLDNRIRTGTEDAMLEGGRIHRKLQSEAGPEYQPEVPLAYRFHTEDYDLLLDGRADGIVPHAEESSQGPLAMIDEIKGTYRQLKYLTEPVPVHLAQAKCYAAMHLLAEGDAYSAAFILVRMTYCSLDDEEVKYFHFRFSKDSLLSWFDQLLEDYRKWTDFRFAWTQARTISIHKTEFPYPYREGQRDLVAGVYRTIVHGRKLFLEAPTGTGKTIATVFPSIKAMGEGKADRIFYLTAKTITRTVAEDCVALLRSSGGLKLKSVTLTARDKICFLEKSDCNPASCPNYAKGHYDRVNDALYDLLTNEDSFDRDTILAYAQKHRVCPFEFSLDLSLFSDMIIGDYNYLFDPFVYLQRFFGAGRKEQYIFLVDEAHNLVDRGRDMYSADLTKEEFLTMKSALKDVPHMKGIAGLIDKCNKEFLRLRHECDEEDIGIGDGGALVALPQSVDALSARLTNLSQVLSKYLDDHREGPVRDELLDFYFRISRFLTIYDLADEHYTTYTEHGADGSFTLKLFCVDPSKNLADCMGRGISTILFSATLLPVQYYKRLLGGTPEDFEIYATSVFDPDRCGIFIDRDVTTLYKRRSDMEYYQIAKGISEILSAHAGNYLVFFPSHAFLERVAENYRDYFLNEDTTDLILQETRMSEEAREAFLDRFCEGNQINLGELIHMEIETEEDRSALGFCVMGGIFSEGIDLRNDSLIGVIIVGTGLPQVCTERELLRNHFGSFDYAYRYPGMNKVLQAAGRVIRTETDTGIVALLDDRFLQASYQNLFPRAWKHARNVDTNSIGEAVRAFWAAHEDV